MIQIFANQASLFAKIKGKATKTLSKIKQPYCFISSKVVVCFDVVRVKRL